MSGADQAVPPVVSWSTDHQQSRSGFRQRGNRIRLRQKDICCRATERANTSRVRFCCQRVAKTQHLHVYDDVSMLLIDYKHENRNHWGGWMKAEALKLMVSWSFNSQFHWEGFCGSVYRSFIPLIWEQTTENFLVSTNPWLSAVFFLQEWQCYWQKRRTSTFCFWW